MKLWYKMSINNAKLTYNKHRVQFFKFLIFLLMKMCCRPTFTHKEGRPLGVALPSTSCRHGKKEWRLDKEKRGGATRRGRRRAAFEYYGVLGNIWAKGKLRLGHQSLHERQVSCGAPPLYELRPKNLSRNSSSKSQLLC